MDSYSLNICSLLSRFGHCLSQTFSHLCSHCGRSAQALVFGGYGCIVHDREHPREHSRINGLIRVCVSCRECTAVEYNLPGLLHATLSLVGDNFYVIGGRQSPVKPAAISQLIRLTANGAFIKPAAFSIPPRWRHSATTIDDCILIHGGRLNSTIYNDLLKVNTVTNDVCAVELVGNNVLKPRHTHSACLWGDSILVSGGLTVGEEVLNSIVKLELSGDTATATTLVTRPAMPRIYSHFSLVSDGCLYLLGGVTIPDLENWLPILKVDLETLVLSHCSIEMNPWKPGIFVGACCGTVGDKDVHLFGGGCNCFSFGTHLNTFSIRVSLRQDHQSLLSDT